MDFENRNKVRLVEMVRQDHPQIAYGQVVSILKEIRNQNNGTLTGMSIRVIKQQFVKLKKKRNIQDNQDMKNELRKIKLDKSCMNRTCPYCFRLFCETHSRDAHVKIIHRHHVKQKKIAAGSFRCQECGEKYAHEVSLKRHVKSHSKSSACHVCKLCKKAFTRKDNLWRHEEKIHRLLNMNIDALMEKSGNDCKMCGKKLPNKKMLLAHVSRKACSFELTTQGEFKCTLCSKFYVHKSDLMRHQRTNHGQENKKWECDKCKEEFSYKSTLTRHEKKKH